VPFKTHWILKWVPKSHLFGKKQTRRKNKVKEDVLKTPSFFCGKSMPKDGARKGKSDALVPCLLHFKRLRWFMEFDGKWTLEGHPEASKIDALGTLGSFL
jgi:hypothetical protein